MPGRNGKHAPPRPRLEIRAATASPDEAAAIAAALERFLVETAPAPEPAERGSRWQRAALHEAIGARQIEPSGWGPPVRPLTRQGIRRSPAVVRRRRM